MELDKPSLPKYWSCSTNWTNPGIRRVFIKKISHTHPKMWRCAIFNGKSKHSVCTEGVLPNSSLIVELLLTYLSVSDLSLTKLLVPGKVKLVSDDTATGWNSSVWKYLYLYLRYYLTVATESLLQNPYVEQIESATD